MRAASATFEEDGTIAESCRTARPGDLLTGLLWHVVDLFLDADPHAERHLAELKGRLAHDDQPAVGYVVHAIDVMLGLRAGRFAQAEAHAGAGHGPRPAATLSRARLAPVRALRADPGDAAEARRESATAGREAAGPGLARPAYQWWSATSGRAEPRRAVCRRRAARWVIELGERQASVADSVGMGYLATLLANPGREIPAVQLAAGPGLLSAAAADSAASSGQAVLDRAAVRAYRQRLSKLQADLEAYRCRGEAARAARARAEVDWLAAQLRAAGGLGGRPRSFAGSDELARVSVGKAIRRALTRIATADPAIGTELRETVTTGMRCCYRPIRAI